MRTLGRTALAVLVITGWFLALLWLVLSVSHIAVDRVVSTTCPPVVGISAPERLC